MVEVQKGLADCDGYGICVRHDRALVTFSFSEEILSDHSFTDLSRGRTFASFVRLPAGRMRADSNAVIRGRVRRAWQLPTRLGIPANTSHWLPAPLARGAAAGIKPAPQLPRVLPSPHPPNRRSLPQTTVLFAEPTPTSPCHSFSIARDTSHPVAVYDSPTRTVI